MAAKAAQENQASAAKAKTPTKDTCTNPAKIEKHAFKRQPADGNKTDQAKVQVFSTSHTAEFRLIQIQNKKVFKNS